MRSYNKLTPIETVVTLLVCIIAVALLLPVCTNARNYSKQTICLVNVRSLSQAWTLYHEDNDGYLIGGSTYNSTEYRWVERPLVLDAPSPIPIGINPGSYEAYGYSLNFEARMRGIHAGRLYPYSQNEKLYHCAGDNNYVRFDEPYSVYRTYAISGLMNGEDFRTNSITFPDGEEKLLKMAKKVDQILHPAQKYVFVEEDVVNAPVHGMQSHNLGGYVLMGGSYYWRWWDIPGLFHNDNSTLGFADGHVEVHVWQDPRTIALMTHERGQPEQPSNIQPDNEDIVYMNNGYFACD